VRSSSRAVEGEPEFVVCDWGRVWIALISICFSSAAQPPDQLEPWKERIEEISELSEKTFVIANNHYLGQAAANATELKSMLSGKKVKAPQELIERYPELSAFAAS
jgi:Protein of unknown function DUF72